MRWKVLKPNSLLVVGLLIISLVPFTSQASSEAQPITNGGFDATIDGDGWTCTDTCLGAVEDIILEYSEQANEGNKYAFLFPEEALYQDIAVPNSGTRPAIQFYFYGLEGSYMRVKVIDKNIDKVYVNEKISTAASSWTQGSISLPLNSQGKDVRVTFEAVSQSVRLDTITFYRTIGYPILKVYLVSWAGDNDFAGAKVWVKDQRNHKSDLKNLRTKETSKTVLANDYGVTPQFKILTTRSNNKAFKLCAKKDTIRNCTPIRPFMGNKNFEVNFSPDYME